MKANIHPEVKDSKVTCSCGATFTTKSIVENISVEVCNECHPFYKGGASNKTKKSSSIEKFNKRYNIENK